MADQEHELLLTFRTKVYGSAEKVESHRKWVERQIQVSLHDDTVKLEDHGGRSEADREAPGDWRMNDKPIPPMWFKVLGAVFGGVVVICAAILVVVLTWWAVRGIL